MSGLPSFLPLDLHSPDAQLWLSGLSGHLSEELIAVADLLVRAFVINSPFAPGLCCIGGEVALRGDAALADGAERISVTGNGATVEAAVGSCLGETADLMSQFERPGDVAVRGAAHTLAAVAIGGWIEAAGVWPQREIDWMRAREAGSGREVLVPADLCLRRAPYRRTIDPPAALSSGCAAGASVEAATLRAIFELCERDAVALWSIGGRRPRRFPESHPVAAAGLALVEHLRKGTPGRVTSLLDLTNDVGVPVIAAISTDLDGYNLACGAAARLDPAEAARAAVLEMCQMELAAPVVMAKLAERGDAALNEADRRHLRRAAFAAASCELLQPDGPSLLDAGVSPAQGGLEDLLLQLREGGISIFLVNLTRADVGVPVVRAIAPDLQPLTGTVSTSRFAKLKAESRVSTPRPEYRFSKQPARYVWTHSVPYRYS